MSDTTFTVRLALDDTRQLSLEAIEALDVELLRIQRSSGDIEYVTPDIREYLQIRRKQRSNQRALAAMQNKPTKARTGTFKAFINKWLRR